MRIALLSTSAVPVPPHGYGGTELVVAELAKSLARAGHRVTVFATGDSHPEAELRWHLPSHVWPPSDMVELRHVAFAWRSIQKEESPFDVVHVHQAPAVSFSVVCPTPTVLTLHHDRVDELTELYAAFRDVSYVAISRRQAELVPELAIRHVVYHGLDVDQYPAGDGAGGWLAFLGRFASEKGAHLAIDAALSSSVPLRMGGKPHWVNERYFDEQVKPRLARGQAGGRVTWLGEVAFEAKCELLRGAIATLFPIDWEEPFGLVMVESMLVGTPVVSFARGAAPEIVDDGVTGFVVRDLREMIDRIGRVGSIDRARCRERARERFSSRRMAREYERVYEDAVARKHPSTGSRSRDDWSARATRGPLTCRAQTRR
jgi:glycosyltransferase involved in cell wall biosynthesis